MSDFDIEITPELLITMFNKQYKLQCYMKEKRGLAQPPLPDSDSIDHQHVLAAIYFSSCVDIEWTELQEVYSEYIAAEDERKQELRREALFELIDVWHFVLSVFIFLGLKENYVSKLCHFRLSGIGSVAEYAGDVALAISSVLQHTPYKTWKDQVSVKVLDKEYQDILFAGISVCYNDILDFALYALDSSYEEFVDAYLQKNALNFKRQEDRSLGYLK